MITDAMVRVAYDAFKGKTYGDINLGMRAALESVVPMILEEAAKAADEYEMTILQAQTGLSIIENMQMASSLTSEQIADGIRALAPSGEGEGK